MSVTNRSISSLSAGPLHQHESSHASTLTGGSPDVSLEAQSLPETVDDDLKAHTRHDGKEEPTAFYEEGALSDSESSRDSSCLATETVPRSESNQKLVGLAGKPAGASRWQSEPPEDSRQKVEAPSEDRGRSEPPSQGRVESNWQHKPPLDEGSGQSSSPAGAAFREPPGDARQLSEPPNESRRHIETAVRGESEPPPDVKRLKLADFSPSTSKEVSEPDTKPWEREPSTEREMSTEREPSAEPEPCGVSSVSETTTEPSAETNPTEITTEVPVKSEETKQLVESNDTNAESSAESVAVESEAILNESTAEQPETNEGTAEPPLELKQSTADPAVETTVQPSHISDDATEIELLVESRKPAEEQIQQLTKTLQESLAEKRHVSEPPAEGHEGQAGGRAVSEPPAGRCSSENHSRLDKEREEASEDKQTSNSEHTDGVRDESGSVGEVEAQPEEWVLVEGVDGDQRKPVEEQMDEFPSVQPFQSATSRFILVSNEEASEQVQSD